MTCRLLHPILGRVVGNSKLRTQNQKLTALWTRLACLGRAVRYVFESPSPADFFVGLLRRRRLRAFA
jgi:hypothetical protein